MSDWKQVAQRGRWRVFVRIHTSGSAQVDIGVNASHYVGCTCILCKVLWGGPISCQVNTPPSWKFWARTIPEALERAVAKAERRHEQDRVIQQAENDAKELAEELAQMYAEEP